MVVVHSAEQRWGGGGVLKFVVCDLLVHIVLRPGFCPHTGPREAQAHGECPPPHPFCRGRGIRVLSVKSCSETI